MNVVLGWRGWGRVRVACKEMRDQKVENRLSRRFAASLVFTALDAGL